jgi:hypothetical protein
MVLASSESGAPIRAWSRTSTFRPLLSSGSRWRPEPEVQIYMRATLEASIGASWYLFALYRGTMQNRPWLSLGCEFVLNRRGTRDVECVVAITHR